MSSLEDQQFETAPRQERSGLAVAAALSWIGAWALAVVLGHGTEWSRQALAMPLAAIAALCATVVLIRGRGAIMVPVLIPALVGSAYFAWRASVSPVWDLGRLDLWLVLLFWISLAVGSVAGGCRTARAVLLGGAVLVFLGHGAVALVQATADPAFAVLRPDRIDQRGVSGLYWHRNYLAGFLECLLPLLLAGALVRGNTLRRTGFLILVAAGLVLAYATKSRAGIMAIALGLAFSAATVCYFRTASWPAGKRMALAGTGVLVALAGGLAVIMLVSRVSGDRGRGEDLEAAMGKDSRGTFAGLAYEQWNEAPLLGTGSRTFSYLAVRNWDRQRMKNWLGDPVMVHNDYLQTLAEYGLLGLVCPVAFAGVAISCLAFGRREEGPAGAICRAGAVGALGATMAHGVFDFSLHVLPNLMALGLICGAGLRRSGTSPGSAVWPRIQGITTLAAAVTLVMVGWNTLRVFPAWWRWEKQSQTPGAVAEREALATLREIIATAPDHKLARHYGARYLERAQQDPDLRTEALPEARWALEIAEERHPFDTETVGNLALVYHQLGLLEEATPLHVRAVESAWKRENKYGAMAALSYNLSGLGELRWLERKPEVALGYFELSLAYLEASHALNFRPDRGVRYRAQKEWLEDRIELLTTAGIVAKAPAGVPTVDDLKR